MTCNSFRSGSIIGAAKRPLEKKSYVKGLVRCSPLRREGRSHANSRVLAVVVAYDKTGVQFLDGLRRLEERRTCAVEKIMLVWLWVSGRVGGLECQTCTRRAILGASPTST